MPRPLNNRERIYFFSTRSFLPYFPSLAIMPSFEPNRGRLSSSAEELLSYLFYQTHLENHLAGIEYRQRMLEHWKIPSGSSVLEIGCGQGEFTVCLADAVGPAGRVVAVDPAPAGWGISSSFAIIPE